jgi:hypothetical protein
MECFCRAADPPIRPPPGGGAHENHIYTREPYGGSRYVGPIRLAGGVLIRHNVYAPDRVTGRASAMACWRAADLNRRRCRRHSRGDWGDADDPAATQAKGPVMELSACVFDAPHEDAVLVPCRRELDQTRAAPPLCLTRLDGRSHSYIPTPVGSRVAVASCRVIETEVS